jgi:hypothetical protein
MKKKILFLLTFLFVLISNTFAYQIVLERRVDNRVCRYADKKWFEEHGTVKIYCNEFVSANGKEKFGWAFGIDSDLINNASTTEGYKQIGLRGEDDCPLMYYIKDGRFYIGWVWTNGYDSEVTMVHTFYDFDEKNGYDLYFLYAYACAVNHLLTYGNNITFHEKKDSNGRNFFWSSENELKPDMSFSIKNFPEYVDHSNFRLENGCIDGDRVWLDGEWRNIVGRKYTDKTGLVWIAFYDSIGYHVQNTNDKNLYRWFEPMVTFQTYRTVKMVLIKTVDTNSSVDAGKRIADNLIKNGLWKAKKPMYPGDGCSLGEKGPMEGVITCWYEPFMYQGYDYNGLGDSPNKNQLIDYAKVTVKRK